MCPVCMATAAMIAGSAAGSGGLTALTVGLFRRKTLTSKILKPTNSEEVHYVDQHDGSSAPETGVTE
jgi:hypothetical protein